MSEEDKKAAEALKNEGNAFLSKGQMEQAVGKYSDAIKKNPQNAIYYANRSVPCVLDRLWAAWLLSARLPLERAEAVSVHSSFPPFDVSHDRDSSCSPRLSWPALVALACVQCCCAGEPEAVRRGHHGLQGIHQDRPGVLQGTLPGRGGAHLGFSRLERFASQLSLT